MEFWVLFVLGALAFDIRNFICACNDLRCGGTENETLFENEMLSANLSLSRDTRELISMILELFPLCGVAITGKCVGESVLGRGDSFGYDSKLRLYARGRNCAGHAETYIFPRPPITEKVPAGLVVGVYGDVVILPGRGP